MAEWISVKDKVPTTSEDVLVIVNGKPKENITLYGAMEFASYAKGEGWIVDAYPEWEGAKVTHWMPLPESPKEDAHD